MSSFISESQSEAARLVASRGAVEPLLAIFRKHPRDQWRTMFAELSLALEALEKDGDGRIKTEPTRPRSKRRSRPHVNGAAAVDARRSPPTNGYTDTAAALFASTPNGFTPAELGAALYGAGDPRGAHKSRAVVHHLQHKRKVPVVRDDADGRWKLRSDGRR